MHKNASDRRGKGVVKVKVEKDEQKKMFKDLLETLEAIKVNLADNRSQGRPFRPVEPTYGALDAEMQDILPANATCLLNDGFIMSTRKRRCTIPYPEEEEEEMVAPVYQVHPTYGRGKAIQQPMQMNVPVPRVAAGTSQLGQPRYQNQPPAYCFNCGNPDHYANVCPFGRQGQGAPLILPCQNCKEYGRAAPFFPKPQQPMVVYKQVEVRPREQTALNYGHSAGTEKPEK